MLTPEEIQSREFLVSLRGYDRDEVHAFLDEVAEAFSQLLAEGGAPGTAAPVEDVPKKAVPEPEAEPAVAEDPVIAESPFAAIGAETQRILEAAQSVGDEIRQRAQTEADEARAATVAAAEREVEQLREQAAATQQQIDVLDQRRTDLADRLRQVRESVDLALIEIDDDAVESAETDETNSVLVSPPEDSRLDLDEESDPDVDQDAADAEE